MSNATELIVKVKAQGSGQLTQLQNQLQNLAKQSTATSVNFSQVSAELRKIQSTSANSVNNLKGYSAAWREIANSVDIASTEFKQATLEADKLDKALARTQGRRATGGGLGRVAKITGAVAAGGVFGGPLGAAGAIAGAPFGPEGAAAGAAIGAQLSQLTSAISDTASYAAQIEKLKISLRGVAGSQAEYNQALAAQESVTKNFNVTQLEALEGLTKLTASIKGAGGNVTDAEAVFRGVTAAIKATGGGAEQVQGALLAFSQIFSKGKVSAEELNQIAERLPGTFTLFAKAAGKTGPELAKGLQLGTIGLNDVQKFVDLLQKKFGNLAELIADSSVDAGLRSQIAFQNFSLQVGQALAPIGAQFQDAFAKFIFEITPAAVEAAKNIATAFKFIADNIETIKDIGKLALEVLKIAIAFKAIELATLAYGRALLFVKGINIVQGLAATALQIALTGDASVVAAGKVIGLRAALSSLLGFGTITLGIVIALKGLEQLFAAQQAIDKLRGFDSSKFIKGLGGEAQTKDKLNKALGANLEAQQAIQKKLFDFKEGSSATANQVQELGRNIKAVFTGEKLTSTNVTVERSNLKRLGLEEQAIRNQLPFARAAAKPPDRSVFDRQERDKPKTGKGAANAAAREAASDKKESQKLQREIDELSLKAQGPIIAKQLESAKIERDIADATQEGNTAQVARLNLLKITTGLEEQFAAIRVEQTKGLAASAADADKTNKAKRDELVNAQAADKLRKASVDAQIKIDNNAADAARKRKTQNEDITIETNNQLAAQGKLSREQIRINELAKIEKDIRDKFPEAAEELKKKLIEIAQAGKIAADSFGGNFKKPLQDAYKEATNLGAALGGAAVSGINGLADAFVNFAATGKASFGDFARSVLLDLSRIFARMAIFNLVKAVFPGLNLTSNAKGNVFAQNGIVPFAYGGIVDKPTMFPFAKGVGLMGEAGPEAIMPLKRGADGKLGVAGGGGTSVVVNVDAGGSKVEGNSNQAKQLGQAMSAAVQAELIKQKRPGGLLA